MPGIFARTRVTTSFMRSCTACAVALPFLLKSLMPSSQTKVVMPERLMTSRSSRAAADGPPGNGFSGEYSGGPATWLPPMPAFTTATRLP